MNSKVFRFGPHLNSSHTGENEAIDTNLIPDLLNNPENIINLHSNSGFSREGVNEFLLLNPTDSFKITSQPSSAGEECLYRQVPLLAVKDEVIFLLHTAAEIEHSLLVQYLYAAYSLNTEISLQGEWREVLLRVAREEMAHLLSVQNILTSLSASLNFDREDRPYRSFYPFPFRLERFSLKSVARYVLAEMPELSEIPSELGFSYSTVRADAQVSDGNSINRVGLLYKLIYRLIDEHFDDGDFAPHTNRWQAPGTGNQDGEWDFYERMIVKNVTSKGNALDLLQLIGEQGEAAEGGANEPDSHFRLFYSMYTQARKNPDEALSLEVPTNPTTVLEEAASGGYDYIYHPTSRAWADLFNTRYRILLRNLEHLLYLDRGNSSLLTDRETLRDWVFIGMSVLTSLADKLCRLPRHNPPTSPGGTLLAAGAPFRMPHSLRLPSQTSSLWHSCLVVISTSTAQIANLRLLLSTSDDLLAFIENQDEIMREYCNQRIIDLQSERQPE